MIKALFDLKFEHFITRKLLGVVYAIAVVLILLFGLISLIAALGTGEPGLIVLGLLVVPAVTLLQLLLARVAAEAIVIYFRIGEDVRAIRTTGLRV